MTIGQPTAEEIKLEIGSAIALERELETEVRSRDLVSGLRRPCGFYLLGYHGL